LLNRTATLAELSAQYQLSQSALHRHKQHLLKKTTRSQNRVQGLLNDGCVLILSYFLHQVIQATRHASAENNFTRVFRAASQALGIVKFMHKLDFNPDLDTVYRLLQSPAWNDQESLLPLDFNVFAGSRQGLAHYLSGSCPDLAPGQEDALPANPAAALADLANLSPELLDQLLAGLPQSLDLSNPAPATQKREKSGKKAKNLALKSNNCRQYQLNSLNVKNARKSLPQVQPAAPLPASRPEYSEIMGHPHVGLASAAKKPPEEKRSWIQDLDDGLLDLAALNAIGAGRPYAKSNTHPSIQ
jgi:hypothetical protein